jgi:dipeptide/tripeptide permease
MSNTVHSSRHPAGLWVLFTTELWERFAFYTMRAILVLYLVSISTGDTPGFGWTESEAYKLYGWYTMLVYLSPLLGGWIADRFLGQRMCVIIGAILMALGEFVLAAAEFVRIGSIDVGLESDPVAMWTFYAGLGLMILGNGFFKPCISVMVGQLYAPGDDRRRDAGFMIFYMGINIGAFMSPLVGGTVAEIYGYQYGFLIAGFGMLFGLISFIMFGKYLKGIGDPPAQRDANTDTMTTEEKEAREKALYEQTRPLDKKDYDRMFVILVLAIFVMAFWIAFEQAGSSLNIFAKVNTDRTVSATLQNAVPERFSPFLKNEDFLEYKSVVQKVERLAGQIGREDEVVEGPSFAERIDRFNIFRGATQDELETLPIEEQIARVRGIAAELKRRLRSSEHEETQQQIDVWNQRITTEDELIVEVLVRKLDSIAAFGSNNNDVVDIADAVSLNEVIETLKQTVGEMDDKALAAEAIREALRINPTLSRVADRYALTETGKAANAKIAEHEKRRAEYLKEIAALVVDEQGKFGVQIQQALLTMEDTERKFNVRYRPGEEVLTFPATWYQSVNAMCVVIFIPLFMIMWGILARLGIEPSTPTKFAIGLLLVSVSFVVMIPGAIEAKASGGKAAFYYLLACYLLATWGELCLSPIGLSMVSKLSPARYASQFMGVWFLASSLSYLAAGYMASYFGSGEGVTLFFGPEGGLADFFLVMAVIPAIVGFIALGMASTLKKKMHGIH